MFASPTSDRAHTKSFACGDAPGYHSSTGGWNTIRASVLDGRSRTTFSASPPGCRRWLDSDTVISAWFPCPA